MRDVNISSQIGLQDLEEIDRICDELEAGWQRGEPPHLEDLLDRVPAQLQRPLFNELLILDIQCRRHLGKEINRTDYLRRFPDYRELVLSSAELKSAELAAEFESSWREGREPQLAEFLAKVPSEHRDDLLKWLAPIEAQFRDGESVTGSHTKPEHVPADRSVPTVSRAINPSDTLTHVNVDRTVNVSIALHKIGSYVVLNKIAEHGQGIVYRANHPTLHRQVVIKVSNARMEQSNPRGLLDEARVLAQLNHPNVATVYDMKVDVEHRPYLVMEYIEGRNLADILKDSKFTPQESSNLLATVCSGLQHAHDLGILHLDLKPANIVLRAADKAPKIIDFGLAQLRPAYGSSDISSYGGTYRYMAPEQAAMMLERKLTGETNRELDARADVFALGAILYELLTGKPLRPAAQSELAALNIAKSNPFDTTALDRTGISASLKSTCLGALATSPADRIGSATELALALTAVQAMPPTRRIWLIAAAAACFAVGAFALMGSMWKGSPTGNTSQLSSASTKISVELFTQKTKESVERNGMIGEKVRSASLGQLARVSVELLRPSYCYLFALNPTDDPEWQIQQCYPDPKDSDQTPRLTSSINYPEAKTSYFPLTDGVGQQAFVLITSEYPLKSFETWRSVIGQRLRWQKSETDGVWSYAKGEIEPVFLPQANDRGENTFIGPEQLESTLQSLSDALKNTKQEIAAFAFPVTSASASTLSDASAAHSAVFGGSNTPSVVPPAHETPALPTRINQRHALLVGCNTYLHLPPSLHLRGPANDVQLMRKLLLSRFGFLPTQIRTLCDGLADSIEMPTYINIAQEMHRIAESVEQDDFVVIYMSGHGTQQPDDDPDNPADLEADGLDEVFCPIDVMRIRANGESQIPGAISDDELSGWLTRIADKGAWAWVIFDSCHAGTMLRGVRDETARSLPADTLVPTEQLQAARKRAATARPATRGDDSATQHVSLSGGSPRIVVMYASQANEPTVEKSLPPGVANSKRHGIFTFALDEALQRDDIPKTYDELLQDVRQRYRQWERTTPKPWLDGGMSDFPLLGVTAIP